MCFKGLTKFSAQIYEISCSKYDFLLKHFATFIVEKEEYF